MSDDRVVAELRHIVIEAAKASHKEDGDMPFVQHLEMQAHALCGAGWCWETRCTPSGGWAIELERVRERSGSGQGRLL